jgi:hypothetical protein
MLIYMLLMLDAGLYAHMRAVCGRQTGADGRLDFADLNTKC